MNKAELSGASKRLEAMGLRVTGTRQYGHGDSDWEIDYTDPVTGYSSYITHLEGTGEVFKTGADADEGEPREMDKCSMNRECRDKCAILVCSQRYYCPLPRGVPCESPYITAGGDSMSKGGDEIG